MAEKDGVLVTRKTYDAIASEYARAIDDLLGKNPWIGEYTLMLQRTFLRVIPKSRPPIILDIGGGNGRAVKHFCESGCLTVDADISLGMLNEARSRVPQGVFVQMDMRNLAFAPETFHGVWADGCIYHVPKQDLLQVLRGICQVLKPNGIFSFNFKVGNGEGIDTSPKSYGGAPRYYAYYSVLEIRVLLGRTGFLCWDTSSYPEKILGEEIVHVLAEKLV